MNAKDNPVAWSMLIAELEDVQEHTQALIEELTQKGVIDEIEYGIDIAHIYSHLNRAWHRKNHEDELTDEDWKQASKFPKDIEPL